MSEEDEMLKEFMDLFPNEGTVVPYVELKFRLAGKYGEDKLEEMLEKLQEEGVLNTFEFNNNLSYKSQKEIPISLSDGSSSTPQQATASETIGASGENQLQDLSELVTAIAETVDDDNVQQLLDDYKEDYL